MVHDPDDLELLLDRLCAAFRGMSTTSLRAFTVLMARVRDSRVDLKDFEQARIYAVLAALSAGFRDSSYKLEDEFLDIVNPFESSDLNDLWELDDLDD